jgi:DnaJ like chaperone protein
MNWWGKLIGGAFGFMLGGPLGALLGAALGHHFDSSFKGIMHDESLGEGATERVQAAFFTASFTIMGRLAKSDGRVSEDEIAMARQVMAQMQLSEEQKQAAMRLFNEGKQPDFPMDDVLEQFRKECHRRNTLIQMFLEIQIAVAMADGTLHDQEKALLYLVAERLGYNRYAFDQLLQMVFAQQRFYHEAGQEVPSGPSGPTLDDAYSVLGISSNATDAEVKRAYKKLMSQHHPDRLVSKGLPEEMMQLAKEKTQEIRAAYEQIKKKRGMR